MPHVGDSHPPDADWHRDWHHHRRYQKKEAATPSADNTVVKAGETRAIVDASGAAWTIVNGVVNRNGKPAGYSARVMQITYVNGVVWQQNADRMWWAWDGSKWPGYGTSTSPSEARR